MIDFLQEILIVENGFIITTNTMTKKNLFTPTETDVVLFDEQSVRREWHNDERFFSIVDVIAILSQSPQPSRYWTELKEKLVKDEWYSDLFAFTEKLKFLSADGKKRPWDAANTQTLLRIIQSIPSPNAEPLKQWLASLGNERLEEENDPELGLVRARERTIARYRRMGLNGDEIKRRISMIETRIDLTDEYKARGIVWKEYGKLTNMAYSIFGKNAEGIKKVKGLWKHDNIRDHMTKTEGLLTELTEETSKNIIQEKDAKGFNEIAPCVQASVKIVEETKDKIEELTGKPVLSEFNRLTDRKKYLREKERNTVKKLWKKK